MSFILDALKKSESDRQRQTGPALFEVKITPPRARFPVWAVAIALLLVLNIAVGGWLVLRRPAHAEPAAGSAAVTAGQPQAAGPQGPPATYGPPPAGSPGPAGASVQQQPGNAPLVAGRSGSQGTPPAADAPGGAGATSETELSGPMTGSGSPGAMVPGRASRDAREPTLSATGNGREPADRAAEPEGGAESSANADDYAPATDASSTSPFKGRVKRGTESGVPLYQEAALAPGANLPELRLDLHVYAANPQDRFALINMHKMHEGDSLQDGVRLESITPDGVIMSRNGSKFLLPRE